MSRLESAHPFLIKSAHQFRDGITHPVACHFCRFRVASACFYCQQCFRTSDMDRRLARRSAEMLQVAVFLFTQWTQRVFLLSGHDWFSSLGIYNGSLPILPPFFLWL